VTTDPLVRTSIDPFGSGGAGDGLGAPPEANADNPVRRFLSNRVAVVAVVVLLLLVAVAVFAPWISPQDPNAQDLPNRLRGLGDSGVLGTDEFGRDVLSRLIVGARTSLAAAFEATAIGMVIGVPLGLAAGFRRGAFDAVASRTSDAIMSVPFLVLALTVLSVVGYGLGKGMFVVGLVFVPSFFRITRAATIDVASETFIEASSAIGCTRRRTIVRHILPNILGPLAVQTAVALGIGITAEASLSFLGLGAVPPTSSWGSMLRTAANNIRFAPHLVWAPGIAITVAVLALALVGDGLRDAVGTHRIRRGSKP
jgi:peptide/nickel transport system permease protein